MNNKSANQSETKQTKTLNGCIKSVRIAIQPERDYRGEKNYRTVFGLGELSTLLVDIEVLNKKCGESGWEGIMTIRILRLEGKEVECVAEKPSKIKLEKEDSLVIYTEMFESGDLDGVQWQEGVYRIVADIDGIAGVSDDLYVIPGNGRPEEYFRMLHAGLDRVCKETETEAKKRPHSYLMFNAGGLENIRFFMIAQNLYAKEWVYEFVIRVINEDGSIREMQVAKAANFIKDGDGNSILSFGIDLAYSKDFIRPGEYTAIVSFGGKVILVFEFGIGDKDIPYDFVEEVLAKGGQPIGRKKLASAYSVKDKDEIMDRLYRLVGLRKVKEEVTQMIDYAEFIRIRKENGFSDSFTLMHLIFTGHPGTGKNTVAEMIGELYFKLGLLENGKVSHFKRQDFVGNGVASEEQLIRQALINNRGGVLVIDEAGDFFHPGEQNDRGVVALGMLYNILQREKPDVLVILTDSEEAVNVLLDAFPDLLKVFPRRLCFEDYTPEELMEITRRKLDVLQYRFNAAAEEKFFKQLKAACVANEVDFTNGRYIDDQIEEAGMKLSKRLMANRKSDYTKDELMTLHEEDIVEQSIGDPGKSLEKLNAMVGLGTLKQSIVQHLNYVYFIRERQKHGFDDVMPPLNMIFSGNPGTGKMTVAQMMGEIYHSVGILERPNVVVQDGRSITGEGGTTPLQMADMMVNMAAGGILYVEHADMFTQSEYGVAVFEGLVGNLSAEECEDLIVILGGYPEQIEKMMVAYPGLRSYFPYTFQFNDYKPRELMQIAEDKLRQKNYTFHPKAKEVFAELIRKAYENRDKSFGNALLVERIVEMAIRNMSERTMKIRGERELTRQEITTIRKEDIPENVFEMPKFDRDAFDEEEIRSALGELDRIVGQQGIKKQIRDFVELARHYNHEGIKLSSRMSLQWCFTGNSAMGKGTVARIIARLYKAMGLITGGQVLDFKVERLIGLMEDEGQRSIGEALAKSNGGILLFDEDSPKLSEIVGFRERVRAILMNQMAERPGSYIIIYAEPRNKVAGINGDAEHMSEVVNVLIFEDYTKEELMVILRRRLEKEKMKLTSTARQHMVAFIDSLVSTEERCHGSSRLMRMVADMIVRNCLQRIAKKRTGEKTVGIISVEKRDVAMFTEQFVMGVMKEKKRIGFI